MKKIHIFYLAIVSGMLFTACSDFLDTLPDNRTELDTESKISALLVSAYPRTGIMLMAEMSSDNVMDNGVLYTPYNQEQEDSYLWKDITSTGNDSPQALWNNSYMAIATANQALKAIEEKGNPAKLNPQRGEALMCRAYSYFILANMFCEAYNPQTAKNKLGLPYIKEPETTVNPLYERGTLEELYAKINADIEEGVSLINDNAYSVLKYHFNKKAAYAFAARFNLFYVKPDKSNYQKVIDYAGQVLGNMPLEMLRDWNTELATLVKSDDVGNTYISPKSSANLLIVATTSAWPYVYGPFGLGQRYAQAKEIHDREAVGSPGLWENGSLVIQNLIWNPQEKNPFPKMRAMFEYTDKANGIGFLHAVTVPFSADETLLCRAEAQVLKAEPDYTKALEDINYWITAHSKTGENQTKVTRERLEQFYTNLPYAPTVITSANERSVKKRLHPQGFEVSSGVQEAFVHCVLHLRRIETIHEGLRWFDIKRYGIEIAHNIDGASADILTLDDTRRAIQLPQDVIAAGMKPNPRNK